MSDANLSTNRNTTTIENKLAKPSQNDSCDDHVIMLLQHVIISIRSCHVPCVRYKCIQVCLREDRRVKKLTCANEAMMWFCKTC